MNMQGSIKLFIGPMFSSKSTSMCSAVERYYIAGKQCVIIKYSKDTRYDHMSTGGIVTHGAREFNKVSVITTNNLSKIIVDLAQYEIIGIDEVQFFRKSVNIIQELANSGKVIICAGLDADYQGNPFKRTIRLIPLAEEVKKLKAVCMKCSLDASFTARISKETDIEVIGGSDKYIAVCRKCMWSS